MEVARAAEHPGRPDSPTEFTGPLEPLDASRPLEPLDAEGIPVDVTRDEPVASDEELDHADREVLPLSLSCRPRGTISRSGLTNPNAVTSRAVSVR